MSLPTEGREVHFGTCRRGDTFGEVAVFHGRRTADVEALTDARLLRLSSDSLERIRRRYPRTGAQVYRNLSRILGSDEVDKRAKLSSRSTLTCSGQISTPSLFVCDPSIKQRHSPSLKWANPNPRPWSSSRSTT